MSSFGVEERTLLNDTTRQYFETEYPFKHFMKVSAQNGGNGWDRSCWQACARLGWLGVAVGGASGGADGGLTELAIVMSAAARQLSLEPWTPTSAVSMYLLEHAQSTAARGWLAQAVEGELTFALCHYEPDGGFARDYIKATADTANDSFLLNGHKTFTLHAGNSDLLLVTARMGDASGPLAVFALAPDTPGLTRTCAAALDGRHGASVALDNVHCDANALLFDPGEKTQALVDNALDRGALANAAEAAGAMASVSEQTVDYLKNRQQFGKPLSSFQVLQHRLVDMSLRCEESRAVVMRALIALDSGTPDTQHVIWQTKMLVSRAAQAVGADAIQLHGGMGMTDELPIGHYYKRLLVCASQYGDGDWYANRLSG